MPDNLPRKRALIIGAIGPGVFTLGLVWTIVRLVLTDPSLTLRAVAFAPPHQMMFVGLALSLICVPLALAVANASAEDLELPGFDAKLHAEAPGPQQVSDEQHGRRSYQGYN